MRAKETGAGLFTELVTAVREVIVREAGPAPRLTRGPHGLARAGAGGRPLVLVNDRADVALAAGADGVHVGPEDLSPAAIRALDPRRELVVGLTCHTAAELRAAAGSGADYVGLGAFFSSTTKPGPLPDPRPALRELPADFPLPIYAIGGISAENLAEVMGERLDGVVVSAAIQSAADPAAVARELRARLEARA